MLRSMAASALAIALMLAAAPVRAADVVVVEVRGPALQPGQTLDDSQNLVLKQGEEVTLVAANGSIIKVKGPYDAPPSAAASGSGVDVSNALAALSGGSQRTALGVVRSKNEDVTLPNPWVVDIAHSGKVCVRPGMPVVFWRPQPAAAAKLRITPADRSWRAEAEWPAGASELKAPGNFPINDRQTYLVDAGASNATITLVQVPASLSTDRMRAAWMLEKNCLAQTKALILTMQ